MASVLEVAFEIVALFEDEISPLLRKTKRAEKALKVPRKIEALIYLRRTFAYYVLYLDSAIDELQRSNLHPASRFEDRYSLPLGFPPLPKQELNSIKGAQ